MGYFNTGGLVALSSGVKRVDYRTGAKDSFDFGPLTVVGEPVFAAKPGGGIDEGWLITQCLDGVSGTTFFALFDAEHLAAGPLARMWLEPPRPDQLTRRLAGRVEPVGKPVSSRPPGWLALLTLGCSTSSASFAASSCGNRQGNTLSVSVAPRN